MKLNRNFLPIAILLLGVIGGCSMNRVGGSVMSGLRFKPLKNQTDIQLNYFPQTQVSVSDGAEYFQSLRTDEADFYESALVHQLKELNMKINNDSARFSIEITAVSYKEEATYECRTDTSNNREYCFWLNELNVSVSINLFDRLTNQSRSFSSSVMESTRIKSKLIGDGFKENDGFLDSGNLTESLMESVLEKGAGRTAYYIRKFQKKHP